MKENEEGRASRRKEQIERFAKIEKRDQKEFKIYRLTLDDLNAGQLPLVDPKDESDDYIRRAVDEIADLEETPKWPSGIDAVKREGLHVLRDLIDEIESEVLARADDE